jgi:hypothetical protein
LLPTPLRNRHCVSIVEIRYDPLTDARALQVHASPDSAFAYQAVLEWTRALQARLDECWAVVGDVYGDGRFELKLRTASTNVVAHAVVDPGAKPRPDALSRIWDELGLPAVIPRDAMARERTCAQALATLGGRVRLHIEAMEA